MRSSVQVGDLVRLETDKRIGIVTHTNLRWKGFVMVLFLNNNRHTQVQPAYLEIISESR